MSALQGLADLHDKSAQLYINIGKPHIGLHLPNRETAFVSEIYCYPFQVNLLTTGPDYIRFFFIFISALNPKF